MSYGYLFFEVVLPEGGCRLPKGWTTSLSWFFCVFLQSGYWVVYMLYILHMAHFVCFESGDVAILFWKIRLVSFISEVAGVDVGFSHLVDGKLSFVHLFEVIAKALILIWVLALVRVTSVGVDVGVSVSACETWVTRTSPDITNEFWVLIRLLLCKFVVYWLWPLFTRLRVGYVLWASSCFLLRQSMVLWPFVLQCKHVPLNFFC